MLFVLLLIQVLTYNAWDLAYVSTDRDERIARIGPAVAALAPDVACFQELWVDKDAERVAADLARVGLVHTRRFPSGLVGSGLLVASRFPIQESRFLRYTLGGKPQKPWHGDWYGGKGIARVTIATPAGALDVADTHLHASYGSDEYDLVQLAEGVEAADFLTGGPNPLVLAGDLNVEAGTLPFKLLAGGAQLTPIEREPGIDWVLFRNGANVSVRAIAARRVLDAPFELAGRSVRLSDHDGVLATLELAEPRATRLVERDPADVKRALERLDEGAAASTRHMLIEGAIAFALGIAGIAILRRARRRPAKMLAVLVIAVAVGLASLAALYEPYERSGLLASRALLGRS